VEHTEAAVGRASGIVLINVVAIHVTTEKVLMDGLTNAVGDLRGPFA